jgi:nicotinamide mononucleotide adenylyltransferase
MHYSILFTIGRMNPPTPGHFDLIETLFIRALKYRLTKIHIILSSKTDHSQNPLTPEDKRDIVLIYGIPYIKRKLIESEMYDEKEIEDMAVDILLTHEHNRYSPNDIYSSISHLLTPLRRSEKALFITGPESTYTFDKRVDIERILRKNPISGSIMRTLAIENRNAFYYIYRDYDIHPTDLELIREDILLLDTPSETDRNSATEYVRTIPRSHLHLCTFKPPII